MTVRENICLKHGSLGPGDNVSCGRCADDAAAQRVTEAMDAGYAQGVENTEARAIKRFDALEALVRDLKAGKCRCQPAGIAEELGHLDSCMEMRDKLDRGYCDTIKSLMESLAELVDRSVSGKDGYFKAKEKAQMLLKGRVVR